METEPIAEDGRDGLERGRLGAIAGQGKPLGHVAMKDLAPMQQRTSISAVGQTEKNSLRANVFRVTPESGRRSIQSACLKGAIFRLVRRIN
jgi:hypothetical protein